MAAVRTLGMLAIFTMCFALRNVSAEQTDEIDCTAIHCPSQVTRAWNISDPSGSYLVLKMHRPVSCDTAYLPAINSWGNFSTCMYGLSTADLSVAEGICAGISCTEGVNCTYDSSLQSDIQGVIDNEDGQCRLLCKSAQCIAQSGVGEVYTKCGNGDILDNIEECDDGNNEDGDGCSQFCMLEKQSGDQSTKAASAASSAFGLMVMMGIVCFFLYGERGRKQLDFQEILQSLKGTVFNTYMKAPKELPKSTIRCLTLLGKGNFGEVRKGTYSPNGGHPFIVAIKSLLGDDEDTRDELLREAAIMAQFNHKHIVGLIGVVTVTNPLQVVIEYCEHGALLNFLKRNGDDTTELERFQWAGDIAEGLEYLSSFSFVHRDIAARNIVLDSELYAKIADFGMSRDLDGEDEDAYYSAKNGMFPVRWTAPEALQHRKFNASTDCWAYGICLYEIWTDGGIPYEGMNNQRVWVEVCAGYRLPCPDDMPEDVYEWLIKCWEADPNQRPNFRDLGSFFRAHEQAPNRANSAHVGIAIDLVDTFEYERNRKLEALQNQSFNRGKYQNQSPSSHLAHAPPAYEHPPLDTIEEERSYCDLQGKHGDLISAREDVTASHNVHRNGMTVMISVENEQCDGHKNSQSFRCSVQSLNDASPKKEQRGYTRNSCTTSPTNGLLTPQNEYHTQEDVLNANRERSLSAQLMPLSRSPPRRLLRQAPSPRRITHHGIVQHASEWSRRASHI